MTTASKEIRPFQGGGRLLSLAAAAGVAGMALTAIGFTTFPQQAYHSYLVAFIYWMSISMGALAWIAIFNAAQARWMIVLKRLLETLGGSVGIFALLFIPIAIGARYLFSWVAPGHVSEEMHELLEHKKPYLNVPFFFIRAGIYFVVWTFIAERLLGWSRRGDKTAAGDATAVAEALRRKQVRLGAGSLPVLGMTFSFAAFDWVMSLKPDYFSTMFGAYYFSGGLVGAMAVLVLVTVNAQRAGYLGEVINPNHLHSLGKFLFAFCCFWAYIAFSQFMLTWIANLPEEIPWYLMRIRLGWTGVGLFLIFGHFIIPFLILLSRPIKENPKTLSRMAIWILIAHYVDSYWLVMPYLHKFGPSPHWLDATAFVGVGGVVVAFVVWRFRGRPMVALNDPFLGESTRYNPS